MPVGGTRAGRRSTSASSPRPTATSTPLVAAEEFRDDLFARISGVKVTLPPLRERREDLGPPHRDPPRARAGAPRAGELRRPGGARALPLPLAAERPRAREGARRRRRPRRRAAHRVRAPAAADRRRAGRARRRAEPEVRRPRASGPGVRRATTTSTTIARSPPRIVRRKDELARLLREHGATSAPSRASMGKARMQIQRWCQALQARR